MATDKRFILVQLSDPHIGAAWAKPDSLQRLNATVAALRGMADRPDAIVITGDLADHGAVEEYQLLHERIASIGVPTYAVPGNHDDRDTLRIVFGLDGEQAAPLHASADLGPLRLVMLDSTIPGEDEGDIDQDALAWLENDLASAPDQATILALHHPPLLIGSQAWDRVGLRQPARAALEKVLGGHAQVVRVVAGHLHQAISAEVAGRVVLVSPSIYAPAELDLAADEIAVDADGPPAFVVHIVTDGRVTSHIQPVRYAS